MMPIFTPLIEFLTSYQGLNNSISSSFVKSKTRIFMDDEGTECRKHSALFVVNLISGRKADFTFSSGDGGLCCRISRITTSPRNLRPWHWQHSWVSEVRRRRRRGNWDHLTSPGTGGTAGHGWSIPKKLARDSTHDEGTQRWRPSPEDFDPHHIARFCFSAFSTSSEFLPSLETIILIPYILFKRPALFQRAPSCFALILSSSLVRHLDFSSFSRGSLIAKRIGNTRRIDQERCWF